MQKNGFTLEWSIFERVKFGNSPSSRKPLQGFKVDGILVAFACKESMDKGYEGFISFFSKTKLIQHYEKTLEAVHVGGHRMVIYETAAKKLINRYFNTK